MENQEILTKAIQKAIDGGYPGDVSDYKTDGLIIYRWVGRGFMEFDALPFIFSHPFAKALWGEYIAADPVTYHGTGTFTAPPPKNYGWQHQLQQMVIADDPVKYLGEHLNG